MKPILIIFLFAVIIFSACAPEPAAVSMQTTEPTMPDTSAAETEAAAAVPAATPAETVAKGWKVESFAEGLEVPWSMVFTAPDRMLVSERGGAIREIRSGSLNPKALYVFEDVAAGGEAGLMGLAVDTMDETNRSIYACYAAAQNGGIFNRVVRLRDNETSLSFEEILLDILPSARNHAGCRIRFGPDGKLYITNGDALEPSAAQDINSLAGKILRINPDGSIPDDNPFPGSAVWSFGHRNPQGIDWQPASGLLFSTEHGPSGFDGPPGGDEINLIQAGGNYGWPLVSHDGEREGLVSPLVQFTPAEAPASLSFYSSDVLPLFNSSLFFGALRGQGLVRVVLSETDPNAILAIEKVISDVGRVRDVVQGPDGFIYFSTSNRDGRGTVQAGDDHIYRIVPVY